MDYEKLVTINADDLENEFIRQPNLYLQVSIALSDVNRSLDLTTEEIKYTKAVKATDIRNQMALAGGKSPTAQFLEDTLDSDTDVRGLELDRIDLKNKSAVLFGVLKALDHKKDSMKALSWVIFRNEDT